SKLTLGALALSLVPVLFLVIFSVFVLNRNLDKWFSGPAESMSGDLIDVGQALDQETRNKLSAQAHWMASLLPSQSADVYLQFCSENEIQHAEITSPSGETLTVCSLPDQRPGDPLMKYTVVTDRGEITLIAHPPLNLAQKQRSISGAVASYKQLSVDKRNFRN